MRYHFYIYIYIDMIKLIISIIHDSDFFIDEINEEK